MLNQNGEALKELALARLEDPKDHVAVYASGEMLVNEGRVELGLELMKEGAIIHPGDGTRDCEVARVFEELGRKEEALKSYERALSVNGQCQPAIEGIVRLRSSR
jgi:predicted Zn-dependent protease